MKLKCKLYNENRYCAHVVNGFIYFGGQNGITIVKEDNFQEVKTILQRNANGYSTFISWMI